MFLNKVKNVVEIANLQSIYLLGVILTVQKTTVLTGIISGYVCNHGSPNGERDTASPRGRYGERPQRDSCLKIHM